MDYLATIRHIWVGHQSRAGEMARARGRGLVSAQQWAQSQTYIAPRAKSAFAKLTARGGAATSQTPRVAEEDHRPIGEVVP